MLQEILIKAVTQAIPTYTMGVFQLPVKLCDDLNALSRKSTGKVGPLFLSQKMKVEWDLEI